MTRSDYAGSEVATELSVSNPTIESSEVLIKRLLTDGYLFVRGLLPDELLSTSSQDIRTLLVEKGWLANNDEDHRQTGWEALPDAACCGNDQRHRQAVMEAFRLESLHQLGHNQRLVRLMEQILGSPVLIHPRPFVRIVFPEEFVGKSTSTTAHQDYVSQQGALDTITAWMPVSPCPRFAGPLTVAEKSHRSGVLPFTLSEMPGGMEVADPLIGHWRTTDFEPGDVLLFHSLTVHKSLPNRSTSLRVSADFRFQRVSDPVNEQCFRLDGMGYDWGDVYADWQSVDLQYYWRQWNLKLSAFDPCFLEQRDALVFERAISNDPIAVRELRRIYETSRSDEKRQRARDMLVALGHRFSSV